MCLRKADLSKNAVAGYTLVETIVASGLIALGMVAILSTSGHVFGILKSGRDLSGATQSLQERMEQIRTLAWTQLIAEAPPSTGDDDAGDDTSDDETGTVVPPDESDLLPTEFPDDLADLAVTTPGMADVLATPVQSVKNWGWKNLKETIIIDAYPTGSTPIKVVGTVSANGTTSSTQILSHNADLYYEDLVRVVLLDEWTSADGRTHRQQSQTVVARVVQ